MDTGNVTIFKVVKNFLCWTVVVSIVPTVCKIAHKHSLGYYGYIFPLVHMFALVFVSSRCLVFTFFSDADRILWLAKCLEEIGKKCHGFVIVVLKQLCCDASVLSHPSRKNKSINLF